MISSKDVENIRKLCAFKAVLHEIHSPVTWNETHKTLLPVNSWNQLSHLINTHLRTSVCVWECDIIEFE